MTQIKPESLAHSIDHYRAVVAAGIHCEACGDCMKPVWNGICPDPNCPFAMELPR